MRRKKKEEPLFYDLTAEFERQFGPMGSPGWNAAAERALERYNADLLLEARKEAGLTQAELAKRLGVDKGYISRIERGLTEPMVSTFYKLAAALGFRVDLVPEGRSVYSMPSDQKPNAPSEGA